MEKTIFSGITGIIAFGIVIVAGCIFACGAIFLFGVAPDLENDAAEISDLPEFASGSNGNKVIYTGVITDGDILTSDRRAGDISEYGFVGYVVEVWDVSSTRSSSNTRSRTTTGTWSDAEAYAGNFVLDNGAVTVNPENGFEIDGDMQEYVIPSSSGSSSDTYNGQNLREGSYRVRGIQMGDQVTLVGTRSTETAMSAERIFGGTRDELVSDLESQAENTRTAGYIIMGCSACVFFPGILFAAFSIFGRRLFKKKDTSPAAYAPPPPNTFGSGSFSSGPSNNPFGTPPAGSSSIPSGSFGGNPTINPTGFGTPSTPSTPSTPTPPPPPADDPFNNPSSNPFGDDPPADSNEGQRF